MALYVYPLLILLSICDIPDIIWSLSRSDFFSPTWPSTEIKEQKEYWNGGNLRRENVMLNDTLWRIEYHENGQKKFQVKISQEFTFDTVWTISPYSYNDTIVTNEGYSDRSYGIMRVFDEEGTLLSSGPMMGCRKTGDWTEWHPNGKPAIEYSLNTGGWLAGRIRGYHINGALAYKGKIGKAIVPITIKSPKTYHDTLWGVERSVPDGTWKFYNERGKKIKSIKFKYKDWI